MTVASKTGTVRFQPSEYYLVLSQDTFRLDKDNAFVGGSTLTVTAKKRTDAVSGVSAGEVLITVVPDSGTTGTSTSGSLTYAVTSSMKKITVTLTDPAKTVTHDQRTVMVVKDGATGSPGAAGAAGPSFYMAGTYSSTTSYTRNSFKAPVVQLDGLYYGQKKVGTITGINPKTDVANNGGNWEVFDMFKFIFAEVAFIAFGKLGSAVFNGDYMYSQYGVNSSGTSNQNYTSFDSSLSDPTTNTSFMPNILFDFKLGKAWFRDINALGGKIGGMTIQSNKLYCDSAGGGGLDFEFSGSKFLRVNTDTTALLYARSDNSKIASFAAYGSGAIALELLCNSSGFGYALSSTGAVRMYSRYSSELITVAGLALAAKRGTSFSNPSQNVSLTTAWVDFLVATGNVTLPNANSCPGKILFIKLQGNYTITSSSYIMKASGTTTYTSDTFDTRALFFISDGSMWYEFRCYN